MFDFKSIWCLETAHPAYQEKWSPENPAAGQCLVTALIVQDIYGGDICSCKVGSNSHFINIIDDKIVDLTAEQFETETPTYRNITKKDRKTLLKNKDTKTRYLYLKEKYSIYQN